MRDYATPAQRLSNPLHQWVRESFKDKMLYFTLFAILAILYFN